MNRERLQYFTGEVKQVLIGHAASGGIVTALLTGMLERGELDGASACRLKGLEPEVFIARPRAELVSAQGSIYFVFPPAGQTGGGGAALYHFRTPEDSGGGPGALERTSGAAAEVLPLRLQGLTHF